MMRNLLKKKTNTSEGFTLIELVIAMAIFGFLLYIITAILLVVVSTVNQINQRSYLRSQLEAAMSSMVRDIQFASTATSCGGTNCVILSVPTTHVSGGVIGTVIKTEKLYVISGAGLSTIGEDVTLSSGGGTTTSYLLPSNVSLNSLTFNIEQGNILVAIDAQINDKGGKKIVDLVLSSNVQYNKQ